MSGVEPPPGTPARMGARTFARFQQLIYSEAGIFLRPEKVALVTSRLQRRLGALGLRGYEAYLERVEADAGELQHMLDAVATGHTQFFREPAHFAFVARELAAAWRREADLGRRPRSVRAWSAGCSTGEEAYSLGMVLLGALGAAWSVQIVASDLSQTALRRAAAPRWGPERVGEIPQSHRRHLRRDGDAFVPGEALRGCVRFCHGNLHQPTLAVAGPFDAIFCRNVLIYFDAGSRAGALERLVARLAPGGHLFLGHSEALVKPPASLVRRGASIYAREAPADARRA